MIRSKSTRASEKPKVETTTTEDVLEDPNWEEIYKNDPDVFIGEDGYPYYNEDWVIQGAFRTIDDGSEETRL